jgi:hypothetical protein
MPRTADTERVVLMFAYHYPPENEIGGARPYRFSKYLSKMGYTCRVFTAAKQTGCHDPCVEYVPDPFLTPPRNRIGWQLERAVRKFFLPGDVGMHWSYHASRAARAYIRANHGPRITIFSTFPPLGTHLAAWHLVRSNKLAWIADCRDPLADEFTDRCQVSAQKRVYQGLERALVHRADAVIANTDAALARWQEKFPSLSSKFHLIWNGFDREERIGPLPVLSQDCKILSHVGELYHGRDITLVLKSIERLITERRLSPSRVRVRLIGPGQANASPGAEFVSHAKTQGWLEQVPYQIPKLEAQRVAQTSHALLLLASQCALRVPAKIFEYLQIGRPILAVIQQNSPAQRLLERSGVPYRCLYPSSTPAAIDDTVASFFELPSTAVTPSAWFEEQFNAEHQTQTLDAVIRSLHNVPARGANPWPRIGIGAKRIAVKQNMKVGGKA